MVDLLLLDGEMASGELVEVAHDGLFAQASRPQVGEGVAQLEGGHGPIPNLSTRVVTTEASSPCPGPLAAVHATTVDATLGASMPRPLS